MTNDNVRGSGHEPCKAVPSVHALLALLAAVCFLSIPLQAEDPPPWPANCVSATGGLVYPLPTSGDFFTNFANSTYEIPLPNGGGNAAAGDLNSTYFQLYYSISNMINANSLWVASKYCPVELVIVGMFPDARYFSVTDYDMHYATAQHLADISIDPAAQPGIRPGPCPGPTGNCNYTNPFVPLSTGISSPYTGNQPYVVPVTLGWIPPMNFSNPPGPPTYDASCMIQPYETENALDATQRHYGIEWNANPNPYGPGAGTNGIGTHYTDLPSHQPATGPRSDGWPGSVGSNTAGSVIVRSYLSQVACSNPPSGCGPTPAAPQPYLIVRDVATGCAYTASWLQNWVYQTNAALNCSTLNSGPDAACSYLVSTTVDPTINTAGTGGTQAPVANWLDIPQEFSHLNLSSYTPQACWANGATSGLSANAVAWMRSPAFEGKPGSDDAYIGAVISPGDITNFQINGNVALFQFRLPNDTLPSGATPLSPCPGPPYQCGITGNEKLRYFSITFQYQTNPVTDASQLYIANPDGISPLNANAPKSLVTLADTAFQPYTQPGCTPPCAQYANLVVNLGGTLGPYLGYNTSAVGVKQGVMPVEVPNTTSYSVWWKHGYTVLDLTQFGAYETNVVNNNLPLQMNIRTTLPNSTFTCAGQAVPFATAQYTNWDTAGGGIMGPYVPLVTYSLPSGLPGTAGMPTLPSDTNCTGVAGVPNTSAFPANKTPNTNQPSSSAAWNYPAQYFGTGSGNPPPNLNCGSTAIPPSTTPQIDVVASQIQYPADYAAGCPNGAVCPTGCINGWNTPNGNCTQIIAQPAQYTENAGQAAWQPPVPITITGSGFGYLPWGAPAAIPANVAGQPAFPLDIQNNNGSGLDPGPWDTATISGCQMYVTEWSDSKISLVLSVGTTVQDMYQVMELLATDLSPLTDVSPWMFPAATNCAVNAGDSLTIKITNPQTGRQVPLPAVVPVAASSTQPF